MTIEEFIESKIREIMGDDESFNLRAFGPTFVLEETMSTGRKNSVQVTPDLSELIIFHDAYMEADGVVHTASLDKVNEGRLKVDIWDVKDTLKEVISGELEKARDLPITEAKEVTL